MGHYTQYNGPVEWWVECSRIQLGGERCHRLTVQYTGIKYNTLYYCTVCQSTIHQSKEKYSTIR